MNAAKLCLSKGGRRRVLENKLTWVRQHGKKTTKINSVWDYTCLKSCVTLPGKGDSEVQFGVWVTRRRCTGQVDAWAGPSIPAVAGPTRVSRPGAQDVCTGVELAQEAPVHVWVTAPTTWLPLTTPGFKISGPAGDPVKFCPAAICTVFWLAEPLWMVEDGVSVKEFGIKNCPGGRFVWACTGCCSTCGCITIVPLAVYCPAAAVFVTVVGVGWRPRL